MPRAPINSADELCAKFDKLVEQHRTPNGRCGEDMAWCRLKRKSRSSKEDRTAANTMIAGMTAFFSEWIGGLRGICAAAAERAPATYQPAYGKLLLSYDRYLKAVRILEELGASKQTNRRRRNALRKTTVREEVPF